MTHFSGHHPSPRASRLRPALGRWAALTVLVGAAWWWLLPLALGTVGRGGADGAGAGAGTPFEDALVRCCAVALLASLVWLWAVAGVVLVDLLRGRTAPRRGVPDGVRRLLVGACGLALAGGVGAPAEAAGHRGPVPGDRTGPVLAGLPLPDRPGTAAHVARLVDRLADQRSGHHAHLRPGPSPRRTPEVRAAEVVVRPGDTLWDLAAAALGPAAAPEDVEAAWRACYRENRSVIGTDPDLIRPGQRLVWPAAEEERPR